MALFEMLREVLRTLRAHGLRSFLTLLGIIIGVATLVGVVSVISGLNKYVREKVFALAPDVYVVTKFGIIRSREEFLAAVKRKNIDFTEYERIKQLLTKAEGVAAQTSTRVAVKYAEHRLADMTVNGTTANFGPMTGVDILEGRYFLESEAQGGQQVAIIGWDIKDELFPQLDPLGRTFTVGGVPFRVIGLVAKQGRALGQSQDDQVYVPLRAFQNNFGVRRGLALFIKAKGGVEGVDASVDETRALTRALRHTAFKDPDPLSFVTAESLQDLWRQISAAAFILMVLIASVSLGVGGIVIMNIMLVAVVERTREIGVRMAVGARKQDIRRQFLVEAALLSLAGGLVGVLIGSLLALGVRGVLNFPAQPTPGIVLLGLLLSAGVGMAAGYWPARSASNLPVVDALRAE
jgi:putative ABC transport system permease protein